MKNILLAAASQKNLGILESMISSAPEVCVFTASDGNSVRRILSESNIDMVIINTPLSDEQGIELSLFAADVMMQPVIVITGENTFLRAGEKLKNHGIVVVTRPVDKKIFTCAFNNLLILSCRIGILKKKNSELEEAIEEGKLVNRAKNALMSNLKMTEAQAHRYIEKQAMDLRITKSKVSGNILKTYYNK